MTIELRSFDEIIDPGVPVIPTPRSFARMNERIAVYDNIRAEKDAAGSVQGVDELHRRGRLAQLQRRREALAITPGEQVQYDISTQPVTATMRH